jgi:hypothetical protein
MSQKRPSTCFGEVAEAGLKRRDWLKNTSAVASLYTGFLQTFVSLGDD